MAKPKINLETVINDLDKLRIKDAVFSNDDNDITLVVKHSDIKKLRERYMRKWEQITNTIRN